MSDPLSLEDRAQADTDGLKKDLLKEALKTEKERRIRLRLAHAGGWLVTTLGGLDAFKDVLPYLPAEYALLGGLGAILVTAEVKPELPPWLKGLGK